MTDPNFLRDFAGRYFSADAGKMVPLDLLRAWLSCEHDHIDEIEGPYVKSMDLDRWARDIAR